MPSVPFTYPYPRPAVTCDVVAFTLLADHLAVLLIQRKDDPYKGQWALPGGFVNDNESLERAAGRELSEETGISNARLTQIGAFGDPGRDPRGHTITIAWSTFLVAGGKIKAGDDAAAAEWHPYRSLVLEKISASSSRSLPPPPPVARKRRSSGGPSVRLAFDHAKIVARAYRKLCLYLDDPVHDRTFDLLPSRFTLAELRHIYEVILGRSLPPRTFKKRLFDHGLVVPAAAKPTRKPADQLYRWNRR
jgi:8-oxo-dGTP diphosphatase